MKSREELLSEMEELTRRLGEAEQILHAIHGGEIDALVVSLPKGDQIFTLQGAEHPYRVLVETMNEGAVTISADGTILYCNKYLAAMLMVPQERLTGSAFKTYLAPADRARFDSWLASPGAVVEDEINLLLPAGDTVPVLLSCNAVEAAECSGLSLVLTDISTRKRAERTMLRLNRLYSVLSAINHSIMHTADADELFRECCRIAVEVGGFRLACLYRLAGGGREGEVAAAFGAAGMPDAQPGQGVWDPEEISLPALPVLDGSLYVCNDLMGSDNVYPRRDLAPDHGFQSVACIAIEQNHELVGTLALYADEKDFFDRQQEELLKQIGFDLSFALENLQQTALRREAEHALREETVKRLTTVEELRRNEQLLVQQSRLAAMGEMIGNIAHQWRQPLNNLGILVQQVPLAYRRGKVDLDFLETNTRKAMEYIVHMSETIDDFRNFFKPDKEKVSFRVHDEVEKTISLMEGSFRRHGICLEVTGEADPEILGYPNEFSQVLLNLLMNARDALADRQVAAPAIVITVGKRDGAVQVVVADNAGGIAEEIMDKIFDPYFTTKGPQAGTGVGLFMSKTIIEKNMGGSLTVRNAGDGAEFTIEV